MIYYVLTTFIKLVNTKCIGKKPKHLNSLHYGQSPLNNFIVGINSFWLDLTDLGHRGSFRWMSTALPLSEFLRGKWKQGTKAYKRPDQQVTTVCVVFFAMSRF